jgi:transketolase
LFDTVDQLGVNTIRTLSIDAIQKANSGHPGLPMDSAPMADTLWTKFLEINPATSRNWSNRDRYGASAPGKMVFEKFGFTIENVVNKYNSLE